MDAQMGEQEFVWQIMHDRLNKMDEALDKVLSGQAEQQVQLDQIDEHVHEIKQQQSDMKAEMDTRFDEVVALIKSGVPDGDLDGHRRYHQQMKDRWNWMNDAKTTVAFKVLEVVAIAAVLWGAATLWGGFKVAVGQ